MKVALHRFFAPKSGNTEDEYEDACEASDVRQLNEWSVLCGAVTDGASTSPFSGKWAALIATSYCQDPRLWHNQSLIDDEIKRTSDEWKNWTEKNNPFGLGQPWWREEKIKSGTFAALLGLTLLQGPAGEQRWHAIAVGDCCMTLLRGQNVVLSFPITSSKQFSNSPKLLSSNLEENSLSSTNFKTGEWAPGDVFFLMSDALAQTFLHLQEFESMDCKSFFATANKEDFADFVNEYRESHMPDGNVWLRNDDVTFLRLIIEQV
jgi:hypothetical protein